MGGIEHEAQAASAGIKGLESALRGIMPLVTAITGVATVFETFRKSFAQAAEREQAGQQFEAIAGGADKAASAIAKLEEVSAETGTDFPELAKGAKRLMEAGMSADEAAEATERLQKIALNTGSSFEELADIYGRIMTKQEVSLKDLNKLAAAGIPGIADIAKEFKNFEISTSDADRELERSGELMRRNFDEESERIHEIQEARRFAFEQQRQETDAAVGFASKIGIAQNIFQNWARLGVFRGGGGLGFGGLNRETISELSSGLAELSQETGLSSGMLQKLAAQGKFGFEELLSAAKRYEDQQEKIREYNERIAEQERQKKEKVAEQKISDERYKNQQALLEKQRGLLGQIAEAIKSATDPGGVFANVNNVFDTIAGKWRKISLAISQTFEAFGKQLIDAFKPVTDAIHNQLMPKLQEAANTFGKLLGEAIKTGDFTPVANGIANALTSPEVIGGITAFSDALAAALSKTLTSAFNQIAEQFSSPQKILDTLTKAGLNPATKEFWMGGLGGTPTTPATTPGTMPTPAPTATQQSAPGDKPATESTLKDAVDLLMKLPLLFTVGA